MHPLPNPPPLASLAGEGAVPCHPPAEGSLPSTRRRFRAIHSQKECLFDVDSSFASPTCERHLGTHQYVRLRDVWNAVYDARNVDPPRLREKVRRGGANPSLTRSVQTRSTTPAPRLDPARSAAGSRTRLPRRAEPGSSTRPSARAG